MAEKTLTTDKDAYVDEASPATNFGGGSNLYVRSQGGLDQDGDRRLFVSFDLSQLPDNATEILAATLRLTPQSTSILSRDLRAHEVTSAWTEAGVTWNDQPAVGTDEGLESSGDDPHEWDVTATVQAAFPDGRADVRVKDDVEGSDDGPEQEYAAREGTGQAAELVITFERGSEADLSSQLTVRAPGTGDLGTGTTVQRSDARFRGYRTESPQDAIDGNDIDPGSVAYDVDRQIVWLTDNAEAKVHRVNRDGTTAQTHDLSQPASSGMGVAYDGTDLWFVTSGELQRWSIQADGLTHQETIALEGDETIDDLAWDGSNLWTVADFDEEVHKRDASGNKLRTETVDDVESMAFGEGSEDPLLLEGSGDDRQIVERDLSTFAKNEAWDSELADAVESLTLEERDRQVAAWVPDWETDELLRFSSRDLPSTVTQGKRADSADLSSSVQPGNVSGQADLDAKVAVGAEANLSTTVTAREPGEADLDGAVSPIEPATADFTSTVEPATTSIQGRGRAAGRIASSVLFTDAEYREIGAEAGSAIDWTKDPGTANERTVTVSRVIQLVTTQAAKTFPRERTSAKDHDPDPSRLERGDAILFAQDGDDVQPGDRIAWQGRDWEVVGLLGWEIVTDERVYQEVGLRRLSSVHTARAIGTVQRAANAEIDSRVEVA